MVLARRLQVVAREARRAPSGVEVARLAAELVGLVTAHRHEQRRSRGRQMTDRAQSSHLVPGRLHLGLDIAVRQEPQIVEAADGDPTLDDTGAAGPAATPRRAPP